MGTEKIINQEARTANSRFAKAGVSCFYDSEVLNSSFVHLMKFSAENPRLRKAAKRYQQYKNTMKKITFTLLISLLLFSCSNEEKLNQKIVELETKNKILIDSLNEITRRTISNLKVELTSETVNKDTKINGKFLQFSKLPKYNLYRIDNLTQERKLIEQNITDPNFQFDFKPTSKSDTKINIIAEFDINGSKVIHYGRFNFKSEK